MFKLGGISQSIITIENHLWEDVDPKGGGIGTCNHISYDGNFEDEEGALRDLRGEIVAVTRTPFHRHVLGRLSAIKILVILIDTVATQTLRGMILTLGGLVTFEQMLIKTGCRDLVSVLVQIVALPVIALATLLNPRLALKLAYLAEKMNKKVKPFYIEDHPLPSSTLSQKIVGTVLAIVSIPLSAVRSALRIPIHLLNGNPKWDAAGIIASIICIVKEPIASIAKLFTASGEEQLKRKHEEEPQQYEKRLQKYIYRKKLEEYDADAFDNITNRGFWFMAGI